jgi:hypothetical protein
MHSLRRLSVPALVVLALAGCGRKAAVAPPERFVAANAAAVLVVPGLATFGRQATDLLQTAATFPGGADLGNARTALAGALLFDPLDAAGLASAGLDPARGLALWGVVGKGGEQNPDIVLALPVADAAKLEAAIGKLAKERAAGSERAVDAGAPEVITWRAGAGGPVLFGYAIVEQTALASFGERAVESVRAAAAVPATANVATVPAYQKSMKALGDALALRFFVPAGSPAAKEFPQFKEGLSAGIHAGRDRLGIAAAVLLGEREAAVKAAIAKKESAALLAKLEPSAQWVARGDGDPGQAGDLKSLLDTMAKEGLPPPVQEMVKDMLASLGSGSALGIALLPPAAGSKAKLADAPLAAFRVELLASLKDADKMKATVQKAVDMASEMAGPQQPARGKKGKGGKPDLGKNPWRFPLPGGEVAAAVADGRFALVLGPTGSLEALLARNGTAFKAPTPAAEKALGSGAGGMFVDVPRLAKAVQAIPEKAIADGAQGAMMKSMADTYANAAARILAISLASDLVEGAARGELLVEAIPAPPLPPGQPGAAPAAPAQGAK